MNWPIGASKRTGSLKFHVAQTLVIPLAAVFCVSLPQAKTA